MGISEDEHAALDADGDGLLSAEEIADGISADSSKEPEAVLTQADSGLSSSDFSEIDTNGDGVISKTELMKWLQDSRTNLADIMAGENDSETSGVAGMFTSALEAYQSQRGRLPGDPVQLQGRHPGPVGRRRRRPGHQRLAERPPGGNRNAKGLEDVSSKPFPRRTVRPG